YDPANHQHMVNLRAEKVARVANDIPPQKLDGPASGDLLVLSWGGTFGACATAVHNVQAKGKAVTHCHLRWLNPLPKDLGDILKRFKKVLIPELNLGQLRMIIRARYLVDAIGLNKVQGKPFSVGEVVDKMESVLRGDTKDTEARPEPIDKEATPKAILEKVAHGG